MPPAANGKIPNPKTGRSRPAPGVLKDIVSHVVDISRQEKVFLFRSSAQGRMGHNSDVNLLIIKSGQFDRSRLFTAIYRNVCSVETAADGIILTPEEVERFRDSPCL